MISDILTQSIQKAAKSLGLPDSDIELEHPSNKEHGDFSTNCALVLHSKNTEAAGSPRELAQELVSQLTKDTLLKEYVSNIEIAGPGFINFYLTTDYLTKQAEAFSNGTYDVEPYYLGEHKKVIFEYAHFNTHKAVHIGHIRNIALGESLSRIYEALGNDVVRLSYGGDVGMHIAKCLYGLKMLNKSPKTLDEKTKLLAKAYAVGNNAYEDDKEAREEIIQINKAIYAKEPEVRKKWLETKEWSLEQFEEIYDRMHTAFDRAYYESEVYERGLELSQEALDKGILKKSDGAVVFDGEQYSIHTRVFITSEGNPTYEGKELGIAEIETTKYGSIDKIIHVVAPEQASFFDVTFKVEELMNPKRYKNKQYHFAYGYVRLTSGKMSSRKGTIVMGQWLLDEVKKRVLNEFDTSDVAAETIAVGAVKYSMLKIDPKQEIAFDIDQSIALDGNSGPYLQYTYARAQSVLSKADSKKQQVVVKNYAFNTHELSLIRMLYKYPEVVHEAGKSLSPNIVCNFLFDLSQTFNLFYQKAPILKAEDNQKTMRLLLTKATATVLHEGLDLLGIKTLERM